MKKYILSILAGLAVSSVAHAAQYTMVVNSGTFTNILTPLNGTFYNGAAKVTQVVITPLVVNSNSIIGLVDTPTNSFTYLNPGYTNTVTYATNIVTYWTNYFGVVNSNSFVGIVDASNAVPSSTVAYPYRLTGAANYGTSTTFSGTYYFNNGIYATNSGQGAASVTITFQQ